MDETFNQPFALSFFAATVLLGIVTIWTTRRLIKRAPAPDGLAKQRFMWVAHILAFVFLFVPVVMWTLIALPALSWIPAVLAVGAALYGYWNAPTKDKLGAVVVLAAPAMWLFYGLYEHEMQLWARTVDTPIRVDLELVAPLLYYSSWMVFRFARNATRGANVVA